MANMTPTQLSDYKVQCLQIASGANFKDTVHTMNYAKEMFEWVTAVKVRDVQMPPPILPGPLFRTYDEKMRDAAKAAEYAAQQTAVATAIAQQPQ